MTREETIKLLMCIQAAYPNFKPMDKTVSANVWHMALQEYDFVECQNALMSYITTDKNGFAPSIGQVIDKIHTNRDVARNQLTETQAWSLVSKALRNSTYNSKSEFDALPESVQKAVGSHDILRVWATDEAFNESVVSSNFMRSYKSILNRQAEFERLPSNVRELIGIASEGIKGIESSIS